MEVNNYSTSPLCFTNTILFVDETDGEYILQQNLERNFRIEIFRISSKKARCVECALVEP